MVDKNGCGLARIKCPFYKSSSSNTIKCEGLVEHSSIVLTYESKKERDKQTKIFCENLYDHCEINMLLMKKYEQ